VPGQPANTGDNFVAKPVKLVAKRVQRIQMVAFNGEANFARYSLERFCATAEFID
jgi:hypothetical protein